jgi:hypothetical protein
MPHTRGFTDRETGRALTAWDECVWMMANAGTSGKLSTLNWIKRVMAARSAKGVEYASHV